MRGAALVTLCLHVKRAVLEFQKKKEKIHEASRRSASWHPHPYLCGPPGLEIPLVGSPFHLIHHFLNHPYSPKAYKTLLIPHG